MRVEDIREYFVEQLARQNFVVDKSGVKLVELVGASFVADEEAIFGKPNYQYIEEEINWYKSMSRSVYDLCGGQPPKIWEQVSCKDGYINSNYGHLIYSLANFEQYDNCLKALLDHRESRRAIMIYTRPTMQFEYKTNGMSDFICTNTVQYVIRDGKLHAIVQMRSNDAWAGFRNDRAWQMYVLRQLVQDYNAQVTEPERVVQGDIHWQVGSLHLYDRQFYLIDAYTKGHSSITKSEYKELYPTSKYL